MRLVGIVLGIGAFGWMLAMLGEAVGGLTGDRPGVFFAIFSAIAVAAAVRMITHTQPVYAALHFILVVLSSAVLFLLLGAEFMAFALVIVYAGAILITYVFVIMLAQQEPTAGPEDVLPEYDRVPREPAAAAVVGFIMLALLSNMIFAGGPTIPAPPEAEQVAAESWVELDEMPRQLDEVVEVISPGAVVDREGEAPPIVYTDEQAFARVVTAEGERELLPLPDNVRPRNVQSVGLALVADFPASLELAGIILLMAMFGAVILARKQIELGEEELRASAGMERYAEDAGVARPAEAGPHSETGRGGGRVP